MEWLLLLVAVPVVGAATWGVALAVGAGRKRARANQVVPGVDTRAPRAWAGAHTPEARLHRRLRDTVAALRSLPHVDAAGLQGRAAVEQYVLALDERLVAVASLPPSVRGEPLAEVAATVDRLEQAVAGLVSDAASSEISPDRALGELSEGFAHLGEASAELEALLAPPPQREREPELLRRPEGEAPLGG